MKPAEPFLSAQVTAADYLFLDHTADPRARFQLICDGREQCSADYEVRRLQFPFFAIEYVAAGEGEFEFDGRAQPLVAGCLFAYDPAHPHRIRARGDGLVKYFMDFAGRDAAALLRRAGLDRGRIRHLVQPRWIHDIFDQLNACSLLARSRARALAPRLAELLLLRIADDTAVAGAPPTFAEKTYARCRQFIHAHFASLPSVQVAARRCGIAPAYLTRLFQRFADETPHAFLTRLKMEYAVDLLVRRELPVRIAAERAGFPDPFHFSRVFKRHHGRAPRDFARATLGSV